jgi:hypothetical protein
MQQYIIIEQMFSETNFLKARAMILLAEDFTDAKNKMKKTLKNKAIITKDDDSVLMYEMTQLASKIIGSIEDTPAIVLT